MKYLKLYEDYSNDNIIMEFQKFILSMISNKGFGTFDEINILFRLTRSKTGNYFISLGQGEMWGKALWYWNGNKTTLPGKDKKYKFSSMVIPSSELGAAVVPYMPYYVMSIEANDKKELEVIAKFGKEEHDEYQNMMKRSFDAMNGSMNEKNQKNLRIHK